jgi:hypothetical protein
MNSFVKFFLVFFVIAGVTGLLFPQLNIELGHQDYWDKRGVFFLIFMGLFPRLTLLISTAWGGFLWWLGLIIAPRVLVALMATIAFWNQNPILVTIAWLMAIGGESTEKSFIVRRSSPSFRMQGNFTMNAPAHTRSTNEESNILEAEYKVLNKDHD